ncbi:MAG: hypothetical protein KDK78_03040, partial [Chlamydiia bacterium]|nr:hypothetical protein [Chlamydiia bacterium]
MKARFVVLWALALLVCAFGVHADGNESVDQCACQQQCCGCSYDCADQFYYDCCGDCFCAGCVEFNSRYTYRMLSHVENLRKERVLLHAKRCGDIEPCRLYSGFSLIAIADYQHSNRTSKFGYLMRHPTSSNQIGKDVTEAVLHSMQFQFTGALCNWITVFGEYVYYPEQSFGAGTITTVTRNLTEGRKGYVLLGDLNCFPVYAAIGKMDTPFGQMFSVNPFTSSTMWHAFGGLAYGALLGYDCNGINASLMAVQGGAQFRAHNTPVFGTAVPSRLTNWVADFNYSFELCDICAQVGASYTRSSAYVQNFPVQHFNSGDRNNPAWTAYGQLRWCDWVLKGSFAQTTRVWPGTHNPNAPLDVFAAHKVSSFDVGA